MQARMIVLMGTMVAFCAMGKPDLTGTADELVAHLQDIPGCMTLRAEGELAVEADCAEVVVKARNADRSFKNALAQNQQTRSEIMVELEKAGIPAERIHLSKFSSIPTQGMFSSKIKSYEIESRITIEAMAESDIQAVAGIIDEKEGLSLFSLSFKDTLKEDHSTQALALALSKLKVLKGIYEKELGISLVPRSVGPQPGPQPGDVPKVGKNFIEVSGIAMGCDVTVKSITATNVLERQQPDMSQFDQVLYKAEVSVTFDVRRQDK